MNCISDDGRAQAETCSQWQCKYVKERPV